MKSKSTKIIPLKIDAIIQSEVLVDYKWYKAGDTFHYYKIKEIKNDSVTFFNIETGKEIFKRVSNE